MLTVMPVCAAVQKILKDQPVKVGFYKPSKFISFLDEGGTLFVYNSFTRAMAEISHEEEQLLRQGTDVRTLPCTDEVLLPLIRKRFLVEESTDENQIYLELRKLIKEMRAGSRIKNYVILTTTACNARCFYCFEQGFRPVTMGRQTALDTGRYIASMCGGKEVKLAWFGGEPLCNVTAIDTIVQVLLDKGIKFQSSITTNGFAFDRELAEKARDFWKLHSAIITLDGMPEEHSRRKNYIVHDPDPFARTIRNVHFLLDAGIKVHLRLNTDENNLDSIKELAYWLLREFKGEEKLSAAPAALFESCGQWNSGREESGRSRLSDGIREVRKILRGNRTSEYGFPVRTFRYNHCSADNPGSTTILPDGRLAACQNCGDSCSYGNVREGITDRQLYDRWKTEVRIPEKCSECRWLPNCACLDLCPIKGADCRASETHNMESILKHEIIKWRRMNKKSAI